MQFAAPRPATARPPGRPLATPPASSRSSITPWGVTQPAAGGQPGDKLLPLLRTPFDLVALPGRVALGTLQSLPDILEKIPSDVERLSLLAQDPRSLEEKQAEVLGELEDRVCSYLQKGTDTEGELLESVASAIPEPLKDALPEPLKDALRTRSNGAAVDAAWNGSYASTNGSSAAPPKPLATWTITSDDELPPPAAMEDSVDQPAMSPEAIAASQIAAEVVEVNAAVASLKEQLTALQVNTDASRESMIKLNLREAEQTLARRLEQMLPSHRDVWDTSVQAAVREAEALLMEVRSLNV